MAIKFHTFLALAAVLPSAFSAPATLKTTYPKPLLSKVKTNLISIATHSWELGTMLETITELDAPEVGVFGGPVPVSQASFGKVPPEVIDVATRIVNEKKDPNAGPLLDGDGAAADPASVGVPVLLVNWTRSDLSNTKLSVAAEKQLRFLLDEVPHTPEGGISHRESQVQLWSDFVYMVPPFLAYSGALTPGDEGIALFKQAHNQVKVYRQYLQDNTTGLWMHVLLGEGFNDRNLWGTGNAWAAAGALRVLATIRQSSVADKLVAEQEDLKTWINEILTASWKHQTLSGAVRNYINNPSTFEDSASTALLAASSYRFAQLTGIRRHLHSADRARAFIRSKLNDDGWLVGCVNPMTFATQLPEGEFSPEGQAFVLLQEAAHRDYKQAASSHEGIIESDEL